ncbi:hypothetical protein JMF94_13280 [Desulfovibrio sp. UIB00]|uniref:hypothetical protein n=1 Tax=Desulfovibrio sp. UIB00 TaxID=2804314 RepID=UPI001F0D11EE|nr:hypothetical protein [Desulfovibrio sp. UIB00]MCH5146052.1 hypothetical protein [Desulfovibrio sp. UIB00]
MCDYSQEEIEVLEKFNRFCAEGIAWQFAGFDREIIAASKNIKLNGLETINKAIANGEYARVIEVYKFTKLCYDLKSLIKLRFYGYFCDTTASYIGISHDGCFLSVIYKDKKTNVMDNRGFPVDGQEYQDAMRYIFNIIKADTPKSTMEIFETLDNAIWEQLNKLLKKKSLPDDI